MWRFSLAPALLGLPLDERGLLPLAVARARVAAASTFERGDDHVVAGQAQRPTDADFLWIALLSLETAEEFVREASRIAWKFPTRGGDNVDPVVRYGVGALPWLTSMLGQDGALPSELPMIEQSLLALGPEAIRTVVRARRRFDSDADGLGFLDAWLQRHGDPAWAALIEQAHAGHDPSRTALLALARRSPRTAKKQIVAVLGKAAGQALLEDVPAFEVSAVLRVLDAAASAPIHTRMPWPTLRTTAGHFEVHAMRLVGVRAAKGDDWGVSIEVAQGDLLDRSVKWPAVVQRYVYGSRVPSGGRYLSDARPLEVARTNDTLTAPVTATLDAALAERLDLRPGRSVTGAVESWMDVLAIRAALALARAAIFSDPSALLGALKVTKPQIIVVSDGFAHVDGPVYGTGALAALPSTSVAYRSLAEALVHRDPSRFDPGVDTTDWRLHADADQAFTWS